MINPVSHGATAESIAKYKAEPYVVAADVYGVAPHTGRAGWTWYTGSAGWLYRLFLESLLGVTVEDGMLRVAPVLPPSWKPFSVRYLYRETLYQISVVPAESAGVTLDGVERADPAIPLVDDRAVHTVEVRVVGTGAPAPLVRVR